MASALFVLFQSLHLIIILSDCTGSRQRRRRPGSFSLASGIANYVLDTTTSESQYGRAKTSTATNLPKSESLPEETLFEKKEPEEDKDFKSELITMLAGLTRQGVVDAWEDRQIEPGPKAKLTPAIRVKTPKHKCPNELAEAQNGQRLQFFLIDSDLVEPDHELPEFFERRTAGEPDAPSLIPYYVGP